MSKLLILVLFMLVAEISGKAQTGTTNCDSGRHNSVIKFDDCLDDEMCFQRQGAPREVTLHFTANETFNERGAFLKVGFEQTANVTFFGPPDMYGDPFYDQRDRLQSYTRIITFNSTLFEDRYLCDVFHCPIETNTTSHFTIVIPREYTKKLQPRTTLKLKFYIDNWDKQTLLCAERNLFIIKPQVTGQTGNETNQYDDNSKYYSFR